MTPSRSYGNPNQTADAIHRYERGDYIRRVTSVCRSTGDPILPCPSTAFEQRGRSIALVGVVTTSGGAPGRRGGAHGATQLQLNKVVW